MEKKLIDEVEIEHYTKTDVVDVLMLIAAGCIFTWALLEIIGVDTILAWLG